MINFKIVISRYLVLFLLFSIGIVLYKSIPEAYGSPSFSRQGINEPLGDYAILNSTYSFINNTKNLVACKQQEHNFPSPPDIESVNYFSDGKTLYATLWLTNPFEYPSSFQNRLMLLKQNDSNTPKSLFAVEIMPSQNKTLQAYNIEHIKLLSTLPNLKFNESMPFTLANNPAHKIVYTYTNAQKNLEAMKIWTIKNHKIYTITYIADAEIYSHYLQVIQRMINSFVIGIDGKMPKVTGADGFLTYKDAIQGIKIDYPSDGVRKVQNLGNNTYLVTFSIPVETFLKNGIAIGMIVNVNSVYYTGTTTDYRLQIYWNATTNSWTRELDEVESKPVKTLGFETGGYKVLDKNANHTGFFKVGKNYLNMTLDLGSVSSPNQYNVVSYLIHSYVSKHHSCSLTDLTDNVQLPPPGFFMSTVPTGITLMPGQEKNIELHISSNITFNSHAFLSVNKTKGIQISFSPDKMNIPPQGTGVSLLHLKVWENATARPVTLPIFANISASLPSNSPVLIPITPVVGIKVTGIATPPPAARIIKTLDVTVTVAEPIPPLDQIKSWIMDVFNPLIGVWITITTVVSGVLGWRVWKRKDRAQNNQTPSGKDSSD